MTYLFSFYFDLLYLSALPVTSTLRVFLFVIFQRYCITCMYKWNNRDILVYLLDDL
jgi:hypothetical protein